MIYLSTGGMKIPVAQCKVDLAVTADRSRDTLVPTRNLVCPVPRRSRGLLPERREQVGEIHSLKTDLRRAVARTAWTFFIDAVAA